MLITVGLSLFFFLMSAFLALIGALPPWLAAHLAFAAGILPLILAAIIHFVPVLTRSGDPVPSIRRLPWLVQGAGILVLPTLLGWLPRSLLAAIATVNLLSALILFLWIRQRGQRALGSPHPGCHWYAAALLCLMGAMLAVIVLVVWPMLWPAMRLLHLHLNTLGLLGFAALGTLPVLLPTALKQADPEAARWLRRMRWPMLIGVVLVAAGSAWRLPSTIIPGNLLAASGAACLMLVTVSLGMRWLQRFGMATLAADGVAMPLFAALTGFLSSLLTGVAHAFALMPAQASLLLWLPAFLLPLVTAALSQLLPVWRWPGPAIPARQRMRDALAWHGQLRAMLWLPAAALLASGEVATGSVLLIVGMISWGLNLAKALRIPRSTQ